jgi:hypothetical protein
MMRGRPSHATRRREELSLTLSHALGQIPGMQEALQDRRESRRQLARKVVLYVINSNQHNEHETIDPLATFPAEIREECVDVFDDVTQQQGADPGISFEQRCQALLPVSPQTSYTLSQPAIQPASQPARQPAIQPASKRPLITNTSY